MAEAGDSGEGDRLGACIEDAQDEPQEGRGGLAVELGVLRAPALGRDQALGALVDRAAGERVIAARGPSGETR